ncbi:MAG TPA: hypothetical protein VGO29_09085 [Solirubrobacteraceae bacterium]|nr:hypothetical protein [Solirubrobacteraceae bacterium]
MPRYEMNMGLAFPADEPVARFVVGLAIVNNEWLRGMALMPKVESTEASDEQRGVRAMLARQQAATCFEGIRFVATARERFPEVCSFVDGLNANAQGHYAQVQDAADPNSLHHLPWLREHRNATMHVPKMHPKAFAAGTEPMANAVATTASEDSYVEYGETVGSVRFGFADLVGLQLLPWGEEADAIKKLSRARIALGGFVHEAVDAYLKSLPHGVVRRIQ